MTLSRFDLMRMKKKSGIPLSALDQTALDVRKMSYLKSAAALYADDPLVMRPDAATLAARSARASIGAHIKGQRGTSGYMGVQDLAETTAVKSKFQGARPKSVSDVMKMMSVHHLMPAYPEEIALGLKVLLPKIRSQKATGVSVARALRSPQLKKMSDAYAQFSNDFSKLNALEREELKYFILRLQDLKLVYKKSITQAKLASALQDVSGVASDGAKARSDLAAQSFHLGEAELVAQAGQLSPALQKTLESAINVAYTEADLESYAYLHQDTSGGQMLHPMGTAYATDAQLGALLDYAAPTVMDAHPLISDELETPSVDPAVVSKIEAKTGQKMESKDIIQVSEKVVRNTAVELSKKSARLPNWLLAVIGLGAAYAILK